MRLMRSMALGAGLNARRLLGIKVYQTIAGNRTCNDAVVTTYTNADRRSFYPIICRILRNVGDMTSITVGRLW